MKKMRLVIIDGCVDVENDDIKNDHLQYYIWNTKKGSLEIADKSNNQTAGHGTAIYSILRKYRDKIDIIMIGVPDIEEELTDSSFVNCLKTVEGTFSPDIMNLSLGVTCCENIEKLHNICEVITGRGGVIISAFDNDGAFSYPAAFTCVIGVRSYDSIRNKNELIYVCDDEVNLLAYGKNQIVSWNNPSKMIVKGNSFACAHATNIIIKLLLELPSEQRTINLELVKKILWNNCKEKVKFISSNDYQRKMEDSLRETEIRKIAIFPFNKEMKVLVENQDLLRFEVAGVYDIKESLQIGKKLSSLVFSQLHIEGMVEDVDNIKWANFDMLVIGHLKELSLICKKDLWSMIVQEAEKHGKYIFSLDAPPTQFQNNKLIIHPQITQQDVPVNKFGMMHAISKPVLGVYGTSSKQGKFTLQLGIRREMLKRGYRIGEIGTEPTAALFGMEYCYPMGYERSVNTSGIDNVRLLNEMVFQLTNQNIDLILTGSQSGTITYSNQNSSLFNISQYEFLQGTWPDAVILCVNGYDDVDLIHRTINFIESACDTKVIAINILSKTLNTKNPMIYPQVDMSTEMRQQVRQNLKSNFHIPVYCGPDEIGAVVDTIENYFSEA